MKTSPQMELHYHIVVVEKRERDATGETGMRNPIEYI